MKKNTFVSASKTYKSPVGNLSHHFSAHQQTDFQKSNLYTLPYDNSQHETKYYSELPQENDMFLHSPVNKIQPFNKPNTWCFSMTPVHLKGLDIICKIFGRSRYTVKQWAKEGAPIVFDGVSYISEYNALFAWLLDFYRKNISQ